MPQNSPAFNSHRSRFPETFGRKSNTRDFCDILNPVGAPPTVTCCARGSLLQVYLVCDIRPVIVPVFERPEWKYLTLELGVRIVSSLIQHRRTFALFVGESQNHSPRDASSAESGFSRHFLHGKTIENIQLRVFAQRELAANPLLCRIGYKYFQPTNTKRSSPHFITASIDLETQPGDSVLPDDFLTGLKPRVPDGTLLTFTR